MARLDTIRALEKRGLSPELAEKTVDLGYLLGTLKKSDLKTLRKDFHYKEILQLIDVSKNRQIDREPHLSLPLEACFTLIHANPIQNQPCDLV